MRRNFKVITLVLMLVLMLSIMLTGCSTTGFSNITGINRFDDISKIVIVQNTFISEGHISQSLSKEYSKDNEIMALFNILNGSSYRSDQVDEFRVPEFFVKIYVKGKKGYIEYRWDNRFIACDGYDGKLKEGFYSMDEANVYLQKLQDIFFEY